MPKPRLKLTVEDYQKIRELRKQGLSLGQIAKQFNITEAHVWRIVKGGQLHPDEVRRKEQPKVEVVNEWPAGKPQGKALSNGNEKPRAMAEESIAVKVALQERQIQELSEALQARDKILSEIQKAQQEILNQLKEFAKKPLQMEKHNDRLQVVCPNCGVSGSYQLEKVAPRTFDEVLALFDQPHEGGFDAFHCKNCRPKIDAKLREHGFELKEIGKK